MASITITNNSGLNAEPESVRKKFDFSSLPIAQLQWGMLMSPVRPETGTLCNGTLMAYTHFSTSAKVSWLQHWDIFRPNTTAVWYLGPGTLVQTPRHYCQGVWPLQLTAEHRWWRVDSDGGARGLRNECIWWKVTLGYSCGRIHRNCPNISPKTCLKTSQFLS